MSYDKIESQASCPSCSHILRVFVTPDFQPKDEPRSFKEWDLFRTPLGEMVSKLDFNFYSLCPRCSNFLKGQGHIVNGRISTFLDPRTKIWLSARAFFDSKKGIESDCTRMHDVLTRLARESQ